MQMNFSELQEKIDSNKSQVIQALNESNEEVIEQSKQYKESLEKQMKSDLKRFQTFSEQLEKKREQILEQSITKQLTTSNLKILSIVIVLSLLLGLILGEVIYKAINPTNSEIQEQLKLTEQENKDMNNYIAELQAWQVPEKMRYTQEGVKYIKSQNTYTSQDKKTTFIKLEGK